MKDPICFYLSRYKNQLDADFEKARSGKDVDKLRFLNDRIISVCALYIKHQIQNIEENRFLAQ